MLNNRYALTVSLDGVIELNSLYEGYDTLEGRFVWVKFIKPTKYMSRSFISDFIDERTMIDNIECPHLLKVLDIGKVVLNGTELIYIISEYSKGVLLTDMIKGNYIHLEGLVSIATQLLKALSMLHRGNMYHGSLNHSNILVDSDYNVKLIEWGTTQANGGVHIRDYVGKNYLSPSQININYSDYETDFYVLGVILFEVLYNKLPYEPSDVDSEMLSSMDKGVAWCLLSSYHIQSNTELVSVVKKLLSRGDKYSSADEVLVDLSTVLYANANIDEVYGGCIEDSVVSDVQAIEPIKTKLLS